MCHQQNPQPSANDSNPPKSHQPSKISQKPLGQLLQATGGAPAPELSTRQPQKGHGQPGESRRVEGGGQESRRVEAGPGKSRRVEGEWAGKRRARGREANESRGQQARVEESRGAARQVEESRAGPPPPPPPPPQTLRGLQILPKLLETATQRIQANFLEPPKFLRKILGPQTDPGIC